MSACVPVCRGSGSPEARVMQLSESEAQGGSPPVSEGRLRVDMCFMIVPEWNLVDFIYICLAESEMSGVWTG